MSQEKIVANKIAIIMICDSEWHTVNSLKAFCDVQMVDELIRDELLVEDDKPLQSGEKTLLVTRPARKMVANASVEEIALAMSYVDTPGNI